MAVRAEPRVLAGARRAVERSRDHLLSLQHPEGWWKGELETNVTMDAEDLLLREFLGIRTEEGTDLAANWIRSQQRADGTWANFYGGPAELSTTVESYTALRLAGDPSDAAHMREARTYIREAGGLEQARVFTHMWLALFGLWSWDDIPALPPEVVFLPEWFPLNIYDFACWARGPSSGSIAPCICTSATRCGGFGAWPCTGPRNGSFGARRPTARGAASSRLGCIR